MFFCSQLTPKALIVVGARAHMTLSQWREGLLVLLFGRRLLRRVFLCAVATLAVMPAFAAGLFVIVGFHLPDRFGAIQAMSAVQGIQLILLNDVDQFGGVVDVLGIATVAQSLGPAAVVGHVKLVQDAVAGSSQELGVIQIRILRTAIFAVTHTAAQRVDAIDLARPVIGLDAKVVVGFKGHFALSNIALEQALGQRDAGGDAEVAFGLQRHRLVALNVFQISLMFGLRGC